jgi:hypothetical protein
LNLAAQQKAAEAAQSWKEKDRAATHLNDLDKLSQQGEQRLSELDKEQTYGLTRLAEQLKAQSPITKLDIRSLALERLMDMHGEIDSISDPVEKKARRLRLAEDTRDFLKGL